MVIWKDLEIIRNSTPSYELIFKNKITSAYEDITDWTIYFTVKLNMTDIDANAVINKKITVHSEPENGKTLIKLSSSETDLTGNYYYSMDYKTKDNDEGVLFNGRIKFVDSVRDTKD